MFARILKRAITLLAVYAVLIIGIFVIQFKNDSTISEKLGALHITLLTSMSDNNLMTFKNKFNISFSGISISGNDELPVMLKKGGLEQPLSLTGWEKLSDLSCVFKFNQNVDLHLSLSDDSPKAILNIDVSLPDYYSSISIPYTLSAGSSVNNLNDSKIHITNKKISWELVASTIEDNRIIISGASPVLTYSYVDNAKDYSFAMAIDIEASSENAYKTLITNIKDSIISTFHQSVSDSSNISELEAVTYVAIMGEQGKFSQAIDAIPSNFKKNANKTYFSSPYFGNLVNMNETLNRQMQSYADTISSAANSKTFDVFSVRNLSDYLCIYPKSNSVIKLLTGTANADLSEITVYQAAGILSVYDDLYVKNSQLASLLEGAVQGCVRKIEQSCTLDDNRITVSEKGTLLSVVSASQVGDALLRYGKISNRQDCQAGGRLILNSYLKNTSSFDLRTLSEIYQHVVRNNKFYPHFEILSLGNVSPIWAWTCANNITYINNNEGTVNISVEFPLHLTHYMILNGIEPFKTVYMYDMAYRTDPRFETYNASGYVFQAARKTLLLKVRHQEKTERIRFVYNDTAAATTTEIRTVDEE